MKRLQFVIVGILIVVVAAFFFLFSAKAVRSVSRDKIKVAEEVLFKQARAQVGQGNLLKAKRLCKTLINAYPQGDYVLDSQKMIWDLNTKILFSKIRTKDCKIYEIKKGDTLGKIAKKYGTTVSLLKKSNGLKSDLIRPGMKLKVSGAKYSILIDKSQNTLTLKSDDEIFKTYNIATGLDNCTPIGDFKITLKLIDPYWHKTGAVFPPGSPKNILGTRWLALSKQGYGIHGTTEPESIGKQITDGCIRMVNKEVEELYDIVPVGTGVTIVD